MASIDRRWWQASLRVGIAYELRLHGLLRKTPKIVRSGGFDVAKLLALDAEDGLEAPRFDFTLSFAVFIHICGGCRDGLCAKGVHAATSRLRPGTGKLVVSHEFLPRLDPAAAGLKPLACRTRRNHFVGLGDVYCHYSRLDADVRSEAAVAKSLEPAVGKVCHTGTAGAFVVGNGTGARATSDEPTPNMEPVVWMPLGAAVLLYWLAMRHMTRTTGRAGDDDDDRTA